MSPFSANTFIVEEKGVVMNAETSKTTRLGLVAVTGALLTVVVLPALRPLRAQASPALGFVSKSVVDVDMTFRRSNPLP